jgi:hypothetical protein
MSDSSPAGARGNAGPVLARGSKIRLLGVGKDDPLRAKLLAEGYFFTLVTRGSDLVLLGEGMDARQREAARKQARESGNVPVMDVDAFLGALRTLDAAGEAPILEAPRRDAVELDDTHVRLLDVRLRRRPGPPEGRVPPEEAFRHLCLDEHLLQAARTVAHAALHGLPAVLEGETATAKTTAILWVAHLLRQPVVRLNLNGQTDTSELVGRYVPAGEVDSGAQRVSWRFEEGAIPRAMREGWWVILDEMNLAEPQVLERLNPVLEVPATLVLSESDGCTFGPRGQVQVHPEFRLFGTMNPAEYAGRSALSPAFRDRWSIWSFVRPPDDAALLAMLRRLVFGEQPAVGLRGVLWGSPRSEPVTGALAELPDIESVLQRLATFHCAVNRSAGGGDGGASIGRTRRERYVFSRRSLLATLRMFDREVRELPEDDRATAARSVLQDVLERVYLARLQDDADRSAVLAAMRAAGLVS